MKTILKIVVGVVVAIIVVVVGFVALIGGAAKEVQKESDKKSITEDQFRQVKKGTPIEQVKQTLGEPVNEQHTESEGMKPSDCIYYNKPGEIASMYQFCFEGGKLRSKSAY